MAGCLPVVTSTGLTPILLVGTHIMTKIKLHQGIHPLGLLIGLGMETRREVEFRPHEFEKFSPKPSRKSCVLVTYNAFWDDPILDYSLRNNLMASLALNLVGMGMKTPYLLNWSTTTMILPHPSDFGKQTIKSMEMLSYGFFGVGRGWRSPGVRSCSTLSYWHTRQVFTYNSMSSRIWGQ